MLLICAVPDRLKPSSLPSQQRKGSIARCERGPATLPLEGNDAPGLAALPLALLAGQAHSLVASSA